MAYYLVRIGEGSKYITDAYKGGFIAVGWNDVPDLRTLNSVEDIETAMKRAGYEYTPAQYAVQARQVFRFGKEMQTSDTVLSPKGGGEYLVGGVGEYYFEPNPEDTCPYKHRRHVRWFEKVLLKDDMSTKLTYSVGALLTIFSLDKHASELDALIAGEAFTPAEQPQRIRDVIRSRLYELDGKEFEEFVKHLLEVIGFSAEATRYVGDKGIDVNGVLDAEGLADLTLRVQVKRVKGTIGNKEILALRGALGQGDHGCFITLSTFTPQAAEEAQAPGKVPVKLLDGNDLASLILRHFDDIDERYKTLLGVRRRTDFDIESQFEVYDPTLRVRVSEQVSTADETQASRGTDWDTLVCAAKEEGFRHAFLEQRAWWAVRINERMLPRIKYLAIYQVAPISAITYYGEVDRIEPYGDTGKYKLYLKGEPTELDRPVGIGENPYLKPQGPRYARLDTIMGARTLDDVFGNGASEGTLARD